MPDKLHGKIWVFIGLSLAVLIIIIFMTLLVDTVKERHIRLLYIEYVLESLESAKSNNELWLFPEQNNTKISGKMLERELSWIESNKLYVQHANYVLTISIFVLLISIVYLIICIKCWTKRIRAIPKC